MTDARATNVRLGAVHEAGHVVVAHALGARLGGARVWADGSGLAQYGWPPWASPAARAAAAAAGMVAEGMLLPRGVPDWEIGDVEPEPACSCCVEGVRRGADDVIVAAVGADAEEAQADAAAILSDRWPAVERVARALCAAGALGAAEIERLLLE